MTTTNGVCAGCGRGLYDATLLGALTVNGYHRNNGQIEQMLFGWDCPDNCGNEVIDAIRAVVGNPDVGPVNLPVTLPEAVSAPDGALLPAFEGVRDPSVAVPEALVPGPENEQEPSKAPEQANAGDDA